MNKSKTRINRSPSVPEDLDKPRRKSKHSKLSLNTSSEKRKHKPRDSNGQSSIISFFQAKVVPNTDFDSSDGDITTKKNGKNTSMICSESDSDMEITEIDVKKEEKNAFTFMMDNRSKSIGQNSPGRELEEVEEWVRKNERKKRFSEYTEIFHDVSEQKSGKKRKIKDKDKVVNVEKKLKEGPKNGKKMRNKTEFVNKEKLKTTHKRRKQKENEEFVLNCKVKWRMKIQINLSEEDAAKLSAPNSNEIKPLEKLDVEDKAEHSNENENRKSKTLGEKVAPIFNIGIQKQRPDGSTIKARIDFLHSDPPKHVKKCIDKHQRIELPDYVAFPTVSHVRMKPTDDQLLLLNSFPKELVLSTNDLKAPKIGSLTKGCVTLLKDSSIVWTTPTAPKTIKHFKKVLEELKVEIPQYPVYRVFKFLYGRHFVQPHVKIDNDLEIVPEGFKNCESSQMWTDLYRPGTTKLVFGNHSAVNDIKTWLETWVDCTKATRRNSGSSSDFETDGEDSRDKYNAALPRNGLMLVGPHGCGKTMSVYAVCNELGINVLEVNASTKRTGKKLLMELQEATLSHQVNKIENSLQQYLQKSSKGMDKMCLLLIEDVDLVFEQDDGFISALCQLLTTSKRPIILTTTDKNCLYLEKLYGDLITFTKLSSKLASPWLQLVCLVKGLLVNRRSIDALLESNNYDMRTTLLQIQFWVQSGGQFFAADELAAAKINRDVVVDEALFQDDNSNISCLSEDDLPECNIFQRLCVESFRKSSMLDLDMAWWNLDMPPPKCETAMKDALNVLETLSTIDTVYKKFHIFETERQNPTDSLELGESEEEYSSCRETCCSWSRTLFDGYSDVIKRSRKSLDSCLSSLDRAATIRRSKCNSSLAELIPLVCHLQYDSLNLDYFSTLRTMNRTEIARASINNDNKRRRSRFYNYLRGLGLNNGDVNFTILSSIFHVEDT